MQKFCYSWPRFARLASQNIRKCQKQWKFARSFSKNFAEVDTRQLTFDELTNIRRLEANRSIVVQVNSEKSFPELQSYCSQFGEVKTAHHYTIQHGELHYILLEFEDEEAAIEAIETATYNEDLSGIPVQSPFLWFRAGSPKKLKPKKSHDPADTEKILQSVDGTKALLDSELNELLQSATNIEDQITILHRATCLTDLGIRLRFLSARQLETCISGMFPYANARPFGSTVNGFGKLGCDLDLVLRFDRENRMINDSRLVFHTKENLINGRSQIQRQMETIGDVLHLFLPGVSHVRRILQARVPIIKFHHDHLNLEVDLSMGNLTGVYMSELLYMFGQLDARVRPLTFCLRRWAQTCGLTNPSPGRWISNFSLTCLVIFFLQQLKNPVLPPIDLLTKSAKNNDIRLTEDGINCTFLRSLKDISFQSKNETTVNDLLLHFFEFYSQFDFNNKAISLNLGKSITKPDHSAMYIVNPLEQVLNISKNISLEECERFRIEVRNAAWILESEVDTQMEDDEKRDNPWGLLNLFRTPEKTIVRPNMFFKPRMVEVSELFDKENDEDSRYDQIDFKNPGSKSQVQGIRAKARSDMKQIRENSAAVSGKGRRR